MAEGPANVLSGAEDEATRVLPFWHVPARFGLHTIVGTCIFAIIAIPAILLDLGVKKLEGSAVSAPVIYGVKIAEYGLFGTDLLLFLVFLIVTGWRTAKEI